MEPVPIHSLPVPHRGLIFPVTPEDLQHSFRPTMVDSLDGFEIVELCSDDLGDFTDAPQFANACFERFFVMPEQGKKVVKI